MDISDEEKYVETFTLYNKRVQKRLEKLIRALYQQDNGIHPQDVCFTIELAMQSLSVTLGNIAGNLEIQDVAETFDHVCENLRDSFIQGHTETENLNKRLLN